MKCKDFQRYMSSYIESSAPERKRRELESHLATCRNCREAVEETRRMVSFLGEGERAEAPDEFESIVMNRVRALETGPGLHHRVTPGRFSYGFAAAAALVIACLAFFYYYPRSTGPESVDRATSPLLRIGGADIVTEAAFVDKLGELAGTGKPVTLQDREGNYYVLYRVSEDQMAELEDLIYLGGDGDNDFLLRRDRSPNNQWKRLPAGREHDELPSVRPADYENPGYEIVRASF